MRCTFALIILHVASAELGFNSLDACEDDVDPSAFLEVELSTSTDRAGWGYCSGVGDLHVSQNLGGNSLSYNVMGENEYIVMRSQLRDDGKPFFDMQMTQRIFQTSPPNSGQTIACKPRFPHITIGKDLGFKCGDNYVLFQAPKSTLSSNSCRNVNNDYNPTIDYTRFYMKGSVIDPRNPTSKIDFDFDKLSMKDRNWLNQEVRFSDRSGSVRVESQYCEDGCQRTQPERRGGRQRFYFKCGGDDSVAATIQVDVYYCCDGAAYTNFWAGIPPPSLQNAQVSMKNMRNGFCGGWDKTTEDGAKWEQDLNTCRNTGNSAKTYWFIGDGDGSPGSRGINEIGHRHIAHFFTTNDCLKSFVPYDHESIFRKFELGTKDKEWKYNALRWQGDGKAENANNINQEDPKKMSDCQVSCVEKRRKVDNRMDSQLDPKLSKDSALLTITESCAEDEYLDLLWSDEDMKSNICVHVQGQIDIERVDVYCAQQNLQALKVKTSDITQLGNGNQQAVDGVEGTLDLYLSYQNEMESSQATVDYWDDGMCDLKNLDTQQLQVNCSEHVFKDTRVTQDK